MGGGCAGSVRLSYGVPDEESEYAPLGTAAHALAEMCLRDLSWPDAWQFIRWAEDDEQDEPLVGYNDFLGRWHPVWVDKEMADAVQVYLDAVRQRHPNYLLAPIADEGYNAWVEPTFYCPHIHEYFWGKPDFGYLDQNQCELHLWDYKHGVGVVVEVPHNPQLMYYGCGVLEDYDLWDKVAKVVLHVAQPRGFHSDGPLREWTVSTAELWQWMEETLVPAMNHALESRETASGEHCRFCPARNRACPQVAGDFNELERMMLELSKKDTAATLSNEQVGRFLDLLDVAKIVGKAVGATAFARLESGHTIPGRKLVKAKTNRVWKDDAVGALEAEYGDGAYTLPELKSPAVVEKMVGGKELATRHAYKPDAGMTLARDDDTRPAAIEDMRSLFAAQAKKEKK